MNDYDRTDLDRIIADALSRNWDIQEMKFHPRHSSGSAIVLAPTWTDGKELGQISFKVRGAKLVFRDAFLWIDKGTNARQSNTVSESVFYNRIGQRKAVTEKGTLATMLNSGVARSYKDQNLPKEFMEVTDYSIR